MTDQLYSIKYLTERIAEFSKGTEEIQSKLFRLPIEPLTIEETIKLRNDLMEIQVLSKMLNSEVTKFETENKKPFYKKLLNK